MSFNLLLLLACNGTPTLPTVDLTQPVASGEVRAGVIDSPAALIGGLGSEGTLGDLLLVNDRARFVIQGMRVGSSYINTGGILIDADIVRAPGEPDVDLVEDWFSMPGFGRLLDPSSIEVISDGLDGAAIVRVSGADIPMPYFVGALETDALIQPQGLELTVDYILRPDTPLLEVVTTVTATRNVVGLGIGDALIGAIERSSPWTDGIGLQGDAGEKTSTGFVGHRNDVAIAMLPGVGQRFAGNGAASLLTSNLRMTVAFDDNVDLAAGESHTFTRFWGVGRDLASLTDTQWPDGQWVQGTVTSAAGPVGGARVVLMDGDSPQTSAVTLPDGSYRARLPAEASVQRLIDGQGVGRFFDLPDGAVPYAPFAHSDLRLASLDSLAEPAEARPFAQGYGVSPHPPLIDPAQLTVSVADGLPFSVRVGPAAPSNKGAILEPRPDGLAAAGWSRGGPLTLAVEPGTYSVVVARGPRFELDEQSVELASAETVQVDAVLPIAFDHSGYVWADPHAHATPSHDGRVSMEERLVIAAAAGVQLHVGSDHDRIADYRPLVTALGLDGTLQSIVADEVSPLRRGHLNAYPLEPLVDLPNHGAVSWWDTLPTSTQELTDRVRARHGDLILQANHPLDSGIADAANWSPGFIGRPSYWVDDLDAMEVLNEGEHEAYFPVWLDLVSRGQAILPVGVSDAHDYFDGPTGLNGTWVPIDAAIGAVSNQDVLDAYRSGSLEVGLGVFLDVSVAPGSTLSESTQLVVEARSASYAVVDRLVLYENDQRVQVIDGPSGTFELTSETDTLFVVVAEGDAPMLPLSELKPWAMTNAYRFDANGDGWTSGLPALQGLQ